MNIIELIIIVIFIYVISYISNILSRIFDLNQYAVYLLVGGFFVSLILLMKRNIKTDTFPVCINEVCDPDDYERVEVEKDGSIYKCKCNIKYRLSKGVFEVININGNRSKYKKLTFFGGWKDDTEVSEK
jgi:hypothetical protein